MEQYVREDSEWGGITATMACRSPSDGLALAGDPFCYDFRSGSQRPNVSNHADASHFNHAAAPLLARQNAVDRARGLGQERHPEMNIARFGGMLLLRGTDEHEKLEQRYAGV
jgi:hypothetical protein